MKHRHPNPRVRIVRFLRNRNIKAAIKDLYGDFRERYSGLKKRNKNTSKLLTLSPCLFTCVRNIFGRFWAIPASFSSGQF